MTTLDPSPRSHRGLELFADLLRIPSPSGHEDRMARRIGAHLSEWGYAWNQDPAGNLLVRVLGTDPASPTCCIAAHIDEIGMIVTRVEPDGTLRVDRTGGLYPWKLGEKPVEILTARQPVRGVVSLGSGHSRTAEDGCPSWDGVRVLTGLTSRQLVEFGVHVGSPIVPAREICGPFVFGTEQCPTVAAWTFDNRLGVVAVLEMLRHLRAASASPRCTLIVAFTVEEETGCHGAKLVAQRERPDVFLAVDGSPLVPESPLLLDGRPGIRMRDRAALYDPKLVDGICDIAGAAGVELQRVIYDRAASDASLVYSIGAVPRAACLGYVRDSSHGYEVTPLITFDHLTSVLLAFVTHWNGE